MEETLVSLGFGLKDAQVYIYLALNGPHKAREITVKLLYKELVYRSLRNLQNKEVVKATSGHPAVFSAIPFEDVLNLLAEVKREQEKALREVREELLSNWRKMIKKNSKNNQAGSS